MHKVGPVEVAFSGKELGKIEDYLDSLGFNDHKIATMLMIILIELSKGAGLEKEHFMLNMMCMWEQHTLQEKKHNG